MKNILFILSLSAFLSCHHKTKTSNQQIHSLVLTIYQDSSELKIIRPFIRADTENMRGADIGIPLTKYKELKKKNKKISKLIFTFAKDTLLLSKPLDYMMCNPPDATSFFATKNNDTDLYGKKDDSIFWFYMLHNIGRRNDLKKLKKFARPRDTLKGTGE